MVLWICSQFVRVLEGQNHLDPLQLAGVLSPEQVEQMSSAQHPPLFAASEMRAALAAALCVDDTTTAAVGSSRAVKLRGLENYVDGLVGSVGGMERIRGTKLPLVYVTHLRTFLMLYLLAMPPIFQQSWGWGTIPAVSITAFALLGVEGAATECEDPFATAHGNQLHLEIYCATLNNNVEQLTQHHR